MSEHNKTLMRRAVEEVWNQGNVDILEELVASDFTVSYTHLTLPTILRV